MKALLEAVQPGDKDWDLVRAIDPTRLPAHIAVIMDGNGRWAGRRRLPRVAGHKAGIGPVRSTVETCARLGIAASTRAGLTGVWVGDEKVASIGVGVRRGVTIHGVALNVGTELGYFAAIVPCRLPNLKVTSLDRLGCAVSVRTVGDVLATAFSAVFDYELRADSCAEGNWGL